MNLGVGGQLDSVNSLANRMMCMLEWYFNTTFFYNMFLNIGSLQQLPTPKIESVLYFSHAINTAATVKCEHCSTVIKVVAVV